MDVQQKLSMSAAKPPKRISKKRPNKPMMERRRRARINKSMEELKNLLVESKITEKSKLDKADVLELSVRHLRSLHWIAESSSDESEKDIDRFRHGFDKCYQEAIRYLEESSNDENNNKNNALDTLSTHLQSISDDIHFVCTSLRPSSRGPILSSESSNNVTDKYDRCEFISNVCHVWRPW